MTKFEQIGTEMQYDAYSKEDARRKFLKSCKACCERGIIRVECARCVINCAHDLVIASFDAMTVGRCYSDRRCH